MEYIDKAKKAKEKVLEAYKDIYEALERTLRKLPSLGEVKSD